MVPLVFKTSLGAVRFPEGSTPSLLRQSYLRREVMLESIRISANVRIKLHAANREVSPSELNVVQQGAKKYPRGD